MPYRCIPDICLEASATVAHLYSLLRELNDRVKHRYGTSTFWRGRQCNGFVLDSFEYAVADSERSSITSWKLFRCSSIYTIILGVSNNTGHHRVCAPAQIHCIVVIVKIRLGPTWK
eukprot:GILK01022180.1.p2 GENE.GILK01022180.1~~GILK01022180.1.p2  ORF type:complete len:116 (-),score=1.88 GILK01022180.1:5-352(-)